MMGREKLARLKGRVKIKPKDPPNTGVILDSYTERDGTHLRLYVRSHVAAHHIPAFFERERVYTSQDGEHSMTVNGFWAVQHHYPGVETYEVNGPHMDLGGTEGDKVFREAAEDPKIQEIMRELGGVLVSVKPDKKRRRGGGKTD